MKTYEIRKQRGEVLLAIAIKREDRERIHEAAQRAGKSTRQFILQAIQKEISQQSVQ